MLLSDLCIGFAAQTSLKGLDRTLSVVNEASAPKPQTP